MTSPRYVNQHSLLTIIFLLNATEFLQSGMIAFGASAIMGQINASPEDFVFVTVAYAAIAITSIGVQYWMVERLGWRLYVQLSAFLSVIGSVICASSVSVTQFLIGRSLMALGGAGFMTAARLLINLLPPTAERMKGIAAFAIALSLGNAFAPWFASVSINADMWFLMLLAPAILPIIAALVAQRTLPTDLVSDAVRTQNSPWLMVALFCSSLLGLYVLQRAAFDFYEDATPIILGLAFSIGGLLTVTSYQARRERALLAIRSLLHPRYILGLTIFTFCYVILGANNTVLPILLQRAFGAPWVAIGEIQTIGLLSSFFAFFTLIAILKRRPSPKKFYVIGFVCLFYFAWRLSHLNDSADLITDVLPAIAAFGVFLIYVQVTTAINAFTDLQKDAVGFNHGQMIKNMMSQFGLAIGISGSTLLMQWRTTTHYTILTEKFVNGDAIFGALRDQLTADFGPQQSVAQLGQLLSQQATLLAGLDYFSLLMIVAAMSTVLILAQRIFQR